MFLYNSNNNNSFIEIEREREKIQDEKSGMSGEKKTSEDGTLSKKKFRSFMSQSVFMVLKWRLRI